MDYKPTERALSIISHVAQLEPAGWHSGANISYEVAGDSYEDRGLVKRVLSDLHRAGLLQRIFVQHADRPLPCYLLEPDRLEELIEEWSR